MVSHCMPQALFAVLLGLAFCLALLQGYWRHDAWIYTSSEFHEALEGKFLAEPLHHVMHGLPPEASLVLSLLVIYAFLRSELVRISGLRRLATMPHLCLVLGLFSSGLLSQLPWPTHTLAAYLPLALVCLLPQSKTLRVLFLRQWGELSLLIVNCVVLVLRVALDDVCMRLWRGWAVPGPGRLEQEASAPLMPYSPDVRGERALREMNNRSARWHCCLPSTAR